MKLHCDCDRIIIIIRGSTPSAVGPRCSSSTVLSSHLKTCFALIAMTSSSTPIYFQKMSPAATSTLTPHAPQSSALPPSDHVETDDIHRSDMQRPPSELKVKPHRKPLLRLEFRDLSSDGSRTFLHLLNASSALELAVDTVLRHLYTGIDTSCIPPTRSITLVLRDMDGVAYTTGLDIDDDHKEIHLSTKYIERIPAARQRAEIQGVLVHEMVHCWQHHGYGTAPGGLTEGVADCMRRHIGSAVVIATGMRDMSEQHTSWSG
jgi:hypothetical protein